MCPLPQFSDLLIPVVTDIKSPLYLQSCLPVRSENCLSPCSWQSFDFVASLVSSITVISTQFFSCVLCVYSFSNNLYVSIF